jgi:Mg-chelatase subunit ChlD
MMIVFVVTAAITVDFAYMQLVRTELRTSTDAAAKAGAETLARTQDGNAAIAAAIAVARANKVAQKPYTITSGDVLLGRVVPQANGVWGFSQGATPFNAVRVNGRVGQGGSFQSLPLLFSSNLGHGPFSTHTFATAGQAEVEVCLCLDRSGSMTEKISRNKTRWQALNSAISIFLTEAGRVATPPRTALVTWSSSASLDFALPSPVGYSWESNRSSIENTLSRISPNGTTNPSSGLDIAMSTLMGINGRGYSNKVIILLTDGEANAGPDARTRAVMARDNKIQVHCISMIPQQTSLLDDIANTTGGESYTTTDTAALEAAFRELARNLPIALVE